MSAYAMCNLFPTGLNEDILTYIEKVQDTFAMFGGRFLVHGARTEVVEGEWPGDVVVVEFPDMDSVKAWYASPAYQEILPLRTDHIEGSLLFVDGVAADYDARRTAAELRAATAPGR
ncbi:hypothetical protein GCM10011579_091560 [Streptomyces albiflavescens]|uniref:DUF1330 domain-containing protein n=1 Tax=Streptomyces albiflavescens TaxID=1623582 RepID=A0A917YEK3_9ACTN|nr:DUF1330 domain-containing protein [Streptomyces albiflavescens]GGN93121.1 hypothetical protein GCM10011579_091560 [Streptomyces albiflavescens]